MFSNYSVECGKLFFLDKYDADLKISERESNDKNGWKGQSYLCLKCNRWHITTSNKIQQQENEERLLKSKAKKAREKEILDEKRADAEFKKKLEKIKEDNADLRKMAAKNLHNSLNNNSHNSNKKNVLNNEGTTKNNPANQIFNSNKKSNKKVDQNNKSQSSVKDENRIVESFGDSSKKSLSSHLDPETLNKLKNKLK